MKTRLRFLSAIAVALPFVSLAIIILQLQRAAKVQQESIDRLKQENEQLQDQLVQQRELLREQTLESTRRSVDEFLALFPARFPQGDWHPAEALFEDCWFTSDDGLRLHGWYLPHNQPTAVVLHLHGNAGNVSHRSAVARLLHDRFSVSVMIFDYRGYGRSEGVPTMLGLLSDARAARRDLAEREGIPATKIVLLGESLGGALAVDLAAEDGARGLVLENTFSSLRDVAAAHYPKPLVSMLMADKLNSADKLSKYRGPLLQVHGDADQTVPIWSARKVFAASQEPKTFVVLFGHDHNDPLPERYYSALGTFLERLPE